MDESSKLQAPKSKETPSPKLQGARCLVRTAAGKFRDLETALRRPARWRRVLNGHPEKLRNFRLPLIECEERPCRQRPRGSQLPQLKFADDKIVGLEFGGLVSGGLVVGVVLVEVAHQETGVGIDDHSRSSTINRARSVRTRLPSGGISFRRRSRPALMSLWPGSTRRSSNTLPPSFVTRIDSPGANRSSIASRRSFRAEMVLVSAIGCRLYMDAFAHASLGRMKAP